ncbi:5137_t:CDS:2, partial [Dentiscutata heterogama]
MLIKLTDEEKIIPCNYKWKNYGNVYSAILDSDKRAYKEFVKKERQKVYTMSFPRLSFFELLYKVDISDFNLYSEMTLSEVRLLSSLFIDDATTVHLRNS